MRMPHLSDDQMMSFPKSKVLEAIKKNRIKHKEEYEQAVVKYRAELVKILEKKLADAKENKKVDHSINLKVPCCYLQCYDTAISMFEMTSKDEVDLDQVRFEQLVLDKWDWHDNFEVNTKSYLT